MNAFIAPSFQLLVLRAPVVRDVVGGLAVLRRRVVEQVERLHVPAGVHPGAGLVAELVEDRVAAPPTVCFSTSGSEKPRTPDSVPK